MTIRILVADDSITIQKIVAMAFGNEDAEVQGIGDGQEAFDKVPDFKPDIIHNLNPKPVLYGSILSLLIQMIVPSSLAILLAYRTLVVRRSGLV